MACFDGPGGTRDTAAASRRERSTRSGSKRGHAGKRGRAIYLSLLMRGWRRRLTAVYMLNLLRISPARASETGRST